MANEEIAYLNLYFQRLKSKHDSLKSLITKTQEKNKIYLIVEEEFQTKIVSAEEMFETITENFLKVSKTSSSSPLKIQSINSGNIGNIINNFDSKQEILKLEKTILITETFYKNLIRDYKSRVKSLRYLNTENSFEDFQKEVKSYNFRKEAHRNFSSLFEPNLQTVVPKLEETITDLKTEINSLIEQAENTVNSLVTKMNIIQEQKDTGFDAASLYKNFVEQVDPLLKLSRDKRKFLGIIVKNKATEYVSSLEEELLYNLSTIKSYDKEFEIQNIENDITTHPICDIYEHILFLNTQKNKIEALNET